MSLLAIAYTPRRRSRDMRHVFGKFPQEAVRTRSHSVGEKIVLAWSETPCLGCLALENPLAAES